MGADVAFPGKAAGAASRVADGLVVAGKGAGASDLLSLSRVADADVVKSIPHLDFPLSKVSHADEVIPDDVAGFRTLWEKSDAPVEHAPELVRAHEPALVGAAHESVSARAGAGSVAERGTQTEHVSDTVHSPTSEHHAPTVDRPAEGGRRQLGTVIDRFGPPDGRYTSPVIDGHQFAYDQRSLPYVEDPGQYHQYEVVKDYSDIPDAVEKLPDGERKSEIEAYVATYGLHGYKGKIAPGFGNIGGGTQVQLPIPAEYLEELGILIERF